MLIRVILGQIENGAKTHILRENCKSVIRFHQEVIIFWWWCGGDG